MIQNEQQNRVLPAEWYPQKGVMLTWAHAETDWHPYLNEIYKTLLSLAIAIAKYEKVLVVAQQKEEVLQMLNDELGPQLMQNVTVVECKTNDTWARDHAFITLLEKQNDGSVQPVYMDFQFNGWGKKFESQYDNAINQYLCDNNIIKDKWQDCNHFVLEGGSIESDGEGTIFTTSTCLLAPNRNQPLTKQEIEEQLIGFFNAKRVVWLDHGELIGDDTDGHIDTIVRIAPNDTIVYVGCEDTNDEQYNDFKALKEQLISLKTLDNKPYRLLELPMPKAIYDDENQRLPATYANFLIINNAVILPTYNQPENDKKAAEVLQEAFPDREIISIDAQIVIEQHGSLHCLTMQIPQEAEGIL